MTQVLGLLLAGGEGRRMGGLDKGQLLLQGRPLAQHVLQRLQPQVQQLLISANRHLPEYAALGAPVQTDAPAWQGMGPLAALATLAGQAAPGPAPDYLQLVPCDTPHLPADLVAQLLQRLQQDPSLELVYPSTKEGVQPACLLAQWSIVASVPGYLTQGGRSLRGWIATRKAAVVPFAAAADFANANDPQTLARLEQH